MFIRPVGFLATLIALSRGAAIIFAVPALVTVAPVDDALAITTSAQFVEKAALAGMFEVESSKLPLKKSSEPDVKAFAEKMVLDHTAAGKDLERAAGAIRRSNHLRKKTLPTLERHHQMIEVVVPAHLKKAS